MKLHDARLSTIDRVTRGVLGFTLIGLAYFSAGPLGLYALLPIIAIVPILSAVLGYCPVEGMVRAVWRKNSGGRRDTTNSAPLNLTRHAH